MKHLIITVMMIGFIASVHGMDMGFGIADSDRLEKRKIEDNQSSLLYLLLKKVWDLNIETFPQSNGDLGVKEKSFLESFQNPKLQKRNIKLFSINIAPSLSLKSKI